MNMTKLLKQGDFFKSSDLSLAVTISLWFPLDLIDKTNPKRAEFIFKREQGLDELVESYWSGKLRIEPKQFTSQMRIIKSRLYEN
ncbi:hypothetical protein COY87_01660 [Candidatus Roizmanbacteria bacterium CG_4_10_14_0_8_um_filter_33_9]|uniref:SEA domain-containing protein n=1 Tax=Candidatus Roizmanbacteria bacterium CG_4_10_14_0_8_um_filter_33_9 TaxID=1974826 RepID=A0A2M7QJ05_9BACT|nr:MAG: hypothetical protein COY87_01660 [Candidatus Roizmanbacteria bacterium CG_4_10_14_0_8_um_filter_33_9]